MYQCFWTKLREDSTTLHTLEWKNLSNVFGLRGVYIYYDWRAVSKYAEDAYMNIYERENYLRFHMKLQLVFFINENAEFHIYHVCYLFLYDLKMPQSKILEIDNYSTHVPSSVGIKCTLSAAGKFLELPQSQEY